MAKREVWVLELDDEPEEAFADLRPGCAKRSAQEAAEEFRGSQFKACVVRYVPAPRKGKGANR